MDPSLFETIADESPKMNPSIANGYATTQIPLALQYISDVYRHNASPSFPEGLKYLRSELCTPEEEIRRITDHRSSKRMGSGKLEIAPSDFYLVKHLFEWEGEEMGPYYQYLPMVSDAGTLRIRGPIYHISPVLADLAFSVVKRGLFIPFTRDRLTFERLRYMYKANGRMENTYVVWSAIHHYMTKKRDKVGVMTCLPHYLFAKCGVHDAFKRYAGADVVIGRDEISEDKYPSEEWVICESYGYVPKGCATKVGYTPTNVKLAVRREQYTRLTISMIAGFFYVADYFPGMVKAEWCNSTGLWTKLLGRIIFSDEEHDGKILDSVAQHIESIDDYVDSKVKEMLLKVNAVCDDIYDFFAFTMDKISDFLLNVDPASIYDKQLKVLDYVLLDIVKSIFNLTYTLGNPKRYKLTRQSVAQQLGKHIQMEEAMNIIKGHGEVNLITCPSDNMIFKMTSNVVLQVDATGNRNSRAKGNLSDPAKLMHSSIVEVGSYANLPKSGPDGRSKLSVWLNTGPDGETLRNPLMKPVLDSFQDELDM